MAPEIEKAWLYRYRLPVRKPLPVLGYTSGPRPGWIVALADSESRNIGYGDAAPLIFASDLLQTVERDLVSTIQNEIGVRDNRPLSPFPAVEFAVTSAKADLESAQRGLPLHRYLFADPVASVSVNALVDGTEVDAELAAELAAELDGLVKSDYRCLKVKVGRVDVEADAARVKRIEECVRGHATIRLDANRAWTMSEACRFGQLIADVNFEYIEEPLAEAGRLEELFYRTGWPIALDESVSEALAVAESAAESTAAAETDNDKSTMASWFDRVRGYSSAVILKPTLLGPIGNTLLLSEGAASVGLLPVISSVLESGFGLRTLAALAGNPACASQSVGLSTHAWFADDVCRPPIRFGATLQLDDILSVVPHIAMANVELVGEWSR